MLIISKFYDYYDTAMGLGVDKTIVYKRETTETHIPRDDYDWKSRQNDPLYSVKITHAYCKRGSWFNQKRKYISTGLLGFCGKIYPFAVISSDERDVKYPPTTDVYYDIESAEYNLRGFESGDIEDMLGLRTQTMLQNHFSTKHKFDETFKKNNTPVWIIESSYGRGMKFIKDPYLKSMRLQKIIDPYTAYQDIQMFISGVLGTKENDMVQIEDELMAKKRGFDKWSFRKLPVAKKRRKDK